MKCSTLVGLATILAAAAPAAAIDTVEITIRDHRFVPTEITVPAGQKFRIEVRNEDPTPEEFESHDLRIEKIVVGGGTIGVLAGPLEPGHYTVVGDYHPESTVATLTAVKDR